ncbi:ABC transporter ATP-binding protein [Lederbergia citrea]|uniref:ATP-binding cassette domain-containing protein n=1 Tax=Lederbergia citrea TaxID=2833581 RepID=A0A942ULE1_9BACI|nr:ATP-binding cassette domain-containing protein [Lederbergia citrea]MBS4176876.1 ATP-binding cassette domain-containing protein [Lederbergia citrea]MBS4203444.1 ATP-binding cassette domain-containing protein [Lederbergia citrea]MBS4221887.1 ATP-binding cassette domain-containing protein [Lederbergia citrea]
MSLITVNELSKIYQVRNRKKSQKHSGIINSFKQFVSLHGKYQCITAVNNISFTIDSGDTVGFLGPNGAGKSTVVKMLSGILVPTSGSLEVNGLIPHRDRMNHALNIGVVFGQKTTLWWDLPLSDSFDLLQVIYEITPQEYRTTMKWLVDILELEPILDRPVRQLSLGQRIRAEIAAALLHRPPVLFLDEPTIGLDIAVKQRIRAALRELNQEWGVTILLTTHDLRDIEEICQKLIVIDKGQMIYNGSLANFREQFCENRVIRVAFKDLHSANKLAQELPPEVMHMEQNGIWVSLYYDHTKTSAADIASHVMNKYTLMDLVIEEPSIEKTVAELYRGEVR